CGRSSSERGAAGRSSASSACRRTRRAERRTMTNGAARLGLALLLSLPAAAYGQSAQDQQVTTGRVVATITALEGTVHLPGMPVELRDDPARMVIAKTITDGAGQVSFPDIPPGRYFI